MFLRLVHTGVCAVWVPPCVFGSIARATKLHCVTASAANAQHGPTQISPLFQLLAVPWKGEKSTFFSTTVMVTVCYEALTHLNDLFDDILDVFFNDSWASSTSIEFVWAKWRTINCLDTLPRVTTSHDLWWRFTSTANRIHSNWQVIERAQDIMCFPRTGG